MRSLALPALFARGSAQNSAFHPKSEPRGLTCEVSPFTEFWYRSDRFRNIGRLALGPDTLEGSHVNRAKLILSSALRISARPGSASRPNQVPGITRLVYDVELQCHRASHVTESFHYTVKMCGRRPSIVLCKIVNGYGMNCGSTLNDCMS